MVKIVVNYSGYLELVVDLPLWKMMEFVSWDDDIPNIGKQNVPNHPISIPIMHDGAFQL